MRRRSFLKSTMTALASVAVLGQPSLTFVRSRTVEMVLLEPGLDEVGDFITEECLQKVVEQFMKPFPVGVDFNPLNPDVGVVTGLRIKDNKLIASVRLNSEGRNLVEHNHKLGIEGHELACGWIAPVDVKKYTMFEIAKGRGRWINSMFKVSASLTRNKVQTIQPTALSNLCSQQV